MQDEHDVIVVGAGAGGGPLAARLAEYGLRVLLLEAGPRTDAQPATAPAREVTEIPAFHGVASEQPDVSWAFSVEHYRRPPVPDDSKRGKDGFPGIFYPRATGLGGCTIHNAMITMLGPDEDWNDIADLTGDDSWRASRMHAYFARLERCRYHPRPATSPSNPLARTGRNLWRAIQRLFGRGSDPTSGRHGFDGWLTTSTGDFRLGLKDKQLLKVLVGAVKHSTKAGLDRPGELVKAVLRGEINDVLDPNHSVTRANSPEGVAVIPVAIVGQKDEDEARRGHRSGPRERLLAVEAASKRGELGTGRLVIETDCLVRRVLFEPAADGHPRAVGVEFERGRGLYRAVPGAKPPPSPKLLQARARHEVVLAGGAFNTPQLLMLSGVGDRAHLQEHGIECLAHRPGVGRNLQDRYEVTVVSRMRSDFSLLDGATFTLPGAGEAPDAHLAQWRKDGSGIYTTNGAVLAILKRSRPELAKPDLVLFGVPLPFYGYYRGYSAVGRTHDHFTWAILKSHTRNRDGRVRLRSRDPRDPPDVNFASFQELSRAGRPVPESDPDLGALVDGVQFVRKVMSEAGEVVSAEVSPGPMSEPELRQWILREAWGHHASCTCPMGRPDDPDAVLDSRFRVLGEAGVDGVARPIAGLRVVDASIFPRIPGYFIVSNIYMASEKAADVIAEDVGRAPGGSRA